MITKDDYATIREQLESGEVYNACLRFEKIFATNNWQWCFPGGEQRCPNHDEIYLNILSFVRDLHSNHNEVSVTSGRILLKVIKYGDGNFSLHISLVADSCIA